MEKWDILDKGGKQQKWNKGKEKPFIMFFINLQNWQVQQVIQSKTFYTCRWIDKDIQRVNRVYKWNDRQKKVTDRIH